MVTYGKMKLSGARAMLRYRGIDFAKSYLHFECEREDLVACEYGHEHCAHHKHGACMLELDGLVNLKEAA